MSRKKSVFTASLVFEVLGDNWSEKLTLEEISKEVVKKIGKETTILTTNDATELKRILDDLRQEPFKYINLFDLDAETKTKYQITKEMHYKILDTRASNYPKNPFEIELSKRAQKKKALEKALENDRIRVYGTPQEKRAYYSSQTYISGEEYKKNKKYINKKEWQKVYEYDSYSRKSYSPRARAERKRSRFDWYVIFACMAIPIIIAIVVIYVL